MGSKLYLNEKFIIDEYNNGKSSIEISKSLNVSKPTILVILRKHNVIKKRDRCHRLKIVQVENKYIIYRKCPKCGEDVKVSSPHPTITCRNYFKIINKGSLCKRCSLESQKGEYNPFYGKKHSKETKYIMSKNHHKRRNMINIENGTVFYNLLELSLFLKCSRTKACKIVSKEKTYKYE